MTSVLQTLREFPRIVWILFAGTFINRFGSFVMPFLAIYMTREGYGILQSGLAVSAYGVGHLCSALIGGHLADRIGRRQTIVSSMFFSAAAMLCLTQARGLQAILAVTFFAGLAAELYRPAAAALLSDLVQPEHRVVAFGMYRLAVNLGFAFGPATAGFLATRSFTYLFVGDAITSVAYGFIALAFLPKVSFRSAMATSDEGYRGALRDRRLVLFLVSALSITWVEFQIQSTLPLYLHQQGFTPTIYGLLMSISGLMIVTLELAIIAFTRRFDPQWMIAVGYVLSGAGLAMTGLAHTVPALAATVIVWTLGEMIFAPVSGAYVAGLAPEGSRGRYHGLWVLTFSIGLVVGPVLGTAMLHRDARILWFSCAAAGLVAGALATLKPRQPAN